MLHLPRKTRWIIYGLTRGLSPSDTNGITKEFNTEEDAVAYFIQRELTKKAGNITDAILARVDKYAIDKRDGSPGKYKDVPSVDLRLGNGKGWWEG